MRLKRLLPLILILCLTVSPALAAVGELSLPKNLKSIGEEAFMGNTSIERVKIKEGTLELGSRAFANSSAKEIYLPESMKKIADDAFEDCDAQIFVVRDSYAHEWCIWNNVNYAVIGEEETVLYAVHSVQLSTAAENTADVQITTDEACKLKTEVLSSDKKTVLIEKTVDAEAGLSGKHILVEFGEALPANFVLRAVLTDGSGNELCAACTNRRYSTAYTEFENQSADDFAEEDRIDFGDSGFAVLADNVIKLNASATRDSSGRYTFSSAQNLKAGDIVKLIVSGEETLVKIKSVSKNSNGTLTVAEDSDVYLSEIYDVINLDANMESGEVSRANNIDRNKSVFKKDHNISVGSAKLALHNEMSIRIKFIYDKKKFGEDYFDIQLIADSAGDISIGLGGKIDTWKSDDSPAIQLYNSVVIIPGLSAPAFLSVSIPINIKADVAGNVEFGYANSYGFYYNPDDGFTKCENGNTYSEAKIEGGFEVFAGPEIALTTSLFGKVSAKISGQIGAKVTGKVEKVLSSDSSADLNPEKKHACQGCIDMDIFAEANLHGTLKYKLTKKVSGTLLDINIAAYQAFISDAYYSFKNDPESIYGGKNSFGLTECQNYKYRITGKTMGMNGTEKTGIPVTFSGSTIENTTNPSPHKIYLYPGSYHALAEFLSGEVERDFRVEKSAFGLILEEKEMVIEGYVRDSETEKPISGAKVKLLMPSEKTKTTTTNADGFYRFDQLPGGTYSIYFSAQDYFDDCYENMYYATGTRNSASMVLENKVLMDEKIVRKLMDYMGSDLVKRLKAADIDLSFDFAYYVPTGEKPTYKNGQMSVSVELRSGIKSTYPTFKLDTDLYYEAQCAIYDSGIFDLTSDDIAEFKTHHYSQNSMGRYYCDIETESGINLHINQTPSYEAITYVRPAYSLKNDGNERSWWSSWEFGEMSYASPNRPK